MDGVCELDGEDIRCDGGMPEERVLVVQKNVGLMEEDSQWAKGRVCRGMLPEVEWCRLGGGVLVE